MTTLTKPPKPARLAAAQLTELPFPRALRYVQSYWKQGEHVSLIGPTGAGKTFFKRYLLRRHQWITSFITKNKDDEISRIIREEGFSIQRKEWDGSYDDLIALWPQKPRGRSADEFQYAQRYYFRDAIERMVDQGGWVLDFDEVSYMTDFLGMDKLMRWTLQQGRSDGVTVVAATQRPAFIPLAFYSMPTWLVFWANRDATDLKRIAGLGGVDGKILRTEVSNLAHRQILIVHNRYPYERIRTLVKV